MLEVLVLFGLALVWIIFATISDIKTREIPNWLNFSLIIFALGFRFFYSLFELGDFNFFYVGLGGYFLFFLMGNLFYYFRMFAGGDAKLMIALGAILPIYSSFKYNLNFILLFLFLFLFVGAIYGFIVSVYFGFRNFTELKKEVKIQFYKKKNIIFIFFVFAIIFLIASLFFEEFFYLGILLFLFPYLFLFFVSVDEVCMVRKIKTSKLTIGDWLYRDVFIGKKKIKANWDGLSEKEVALLKSKKKEIVVRYGIQFAPVFLISFILLWLHLEFNFLDFIFFAFGF